MNLTLSLTTTAFYTGLLTLIFLLLSFNIIRLRWRLKVGVGDGGERALTKAIRVHGNFSEYVPLALIMLASYELSGADSLWLHLLGATLLLSRVLHAIGLSKSIGTSMPRFVGMILTFSVLLTLAIANISVFVVS